MTTAHARLRITDAGTGSLTLDGTTTMVRAASVTDARDQASETLKSWAAEHGTTIALTDEEPGGTYQVWITPDGNISGHEPRPAPEPALTAPAPDQTPPSRRRWPLTRTAPDPETSEPSTPSAPSPPSPTTPATTPPAPTWRDEYTPEPPAPAPQPVTAVPASSPAAAPSTPSAPAEPAHTADTLNTADTTPPPTVNSSAAEAVAPAARPSFLTHQPTEAPARKGWAGALNHLGLHLPPGSAERSERADVLAVSQHWPGPRTIAVANPKGGAGKTPTTVFLAAIFALYGGAGVIAWDNNQTRGTLGWRTEQGPHTATLLDLLPHTNQLLAPSAQAADLSYYVHHQPADRYDVLRSKPDALASEQRLDDTDIDNLHAVAAKYYRVLIMDSGNDETDSAWLRMIDHADQLIVPTTTRDDHAEAGALLLESLARRDQHSADLATGAVVVVTQADARAARADINRVADGYRPLAREVVTIPFDAAMVDGVLAYSTLAAPTRRAWLAAAAAVARGL